jgi:hypothetical protein
MSDRDGGDWNAERPASLPIGELADKLRRFGYDIEPPRPGHNPGSGLVARRDLGERVALIAIDSGGRFRIELSWVVDEHSTAETIAGTPVLVTDTGTRAITITGAVADGEQLMRIVTALKAFAAWTELADPEADSPAPEPDH